MSGSTTGVGLGGPADLLIDASDEVAFQTAWNRLRTSGVATEVIGGGSNLVVSDEGFRGVVLRYTANVSGMKERGSLWEPEPACRISSTSRSGSASPESIR